MARDIYTKDPVLSFLMLWTWVYGFLVVGYYHRRECVLKGKRGKSDSSANIGVVRSMGNLLEVMDGLQQMNSILYNL